MSSSDEGRQTSSVDFGSKGGFRPPAPKNDRMGLVVEGKNFVGRAGTIIGAEPTLAAEVFKQIPGLEARHALIGREQGEWFILTPRNVSRPLRLDGVTLPRGERRPLDKVRHHVEFDALRIGLRLSPPRCKRLSLFHRCGLVGDYCPNLNRPVLVWPSATKEIRSTHRHRADKIEHACS